MMFKILNNSVDIPIDLLVFILNTLPTRGHNLRFHQLPVRINSFGKSVATTGLIPRKLDCIVTSISLCSQGNPVLQSLKKTAFACMEMGGPGRCIFFII